MLTKLKPFLSLARSGFAPTCFFPKTFSTTSSRRDGRSLMKMKKMQADFQCEDGRPIFLKAGFRDRVLYCTTLIMCVVGLGGVLAFLYDKIKPASWRDQTC